MNSYFNIEDYILFRGDLTFRERPFTLTDSLILNELSYVDFSTVPQHAFQKGIRLKDAGRIILDHHAYRLKNLYGGQQKFFELAIASKRYGSLMLRSYQDVFSSEDQTQFAAVTFDLNRLVSYVAFRGTDDSIIGWKEDFMISFTRIGSQKLAADYLHKEISHERKYYVGGHSKGGNLALYACSALNEEEYAHILHIYDHDGPNFAEDVFDVDSIKALNDKVTRVIPEFCVIGKIYEIPFADTHIVPSSFKGLNSHDLISWKLSGPALMEAEKNDAHSDKLIQILMEWAHAAPIEERKIFIDEVFDAFAAGGAESVNDITGHGFLKVLKAMSETSPTARRIAESLVRYAVGIA